MKAFEVIKRDSDYVLSKDAESYILSVLCGTIGLFEVEIRLTDAEAEEIINTKECPVLVSDIRYSPEKYSTRQINLGTK